MNRTNQRYSAISLQFFISSQFTLQAVLDLHFIEVFLTCLILKGIATWFTLKYLRLQLLWSMISGALSPKGQDSNRLVIGRLQILFPLIIQEIVFIYQKMSSIKMHAFLIPLKQYKLLIFMIFSGWQTSCNPLLQLPILYAKYIN